jgi:L-lactate dehydrogenase (cytochrome)
VTPVDYRRLAEKRLPRFLFVYIDGGANDELTLAANVADFARVRLRQRVMRDVSGVETATTLAGRRVSMPVALAPVGLLGKPHTIGNLADVVPDPTDLNAYKAWIDAQFDPSVTWKDIEWLRRIWDRKLYIKGVLEADDAKDAVDVGADGVVVSNHGGRQLDGVASSIVKVPEVVQLWETGWKSCSTAACAAASTCSRPSRWAPAA